MGRLEVRITRLLSAPTPRGFLWWDRMLDRCPIWSLPFVILGSLLLPPATALALRRFTR